MASPFERFSRSLTSDNLWLYILTLLKSEAMYPYKIREMVEGKFGFRPGNVTAYIVLKKLESGGYVRASKKEKDQGPEKTYYEITEKGLKELRKAAKAHGDAARLLGWK